MNKERAIFASLMSLGMVVTISFVMTLFNVGVTAAFWSSYFRSMVLSYAVAFPMSYLLTPVVEAVITVICRDNYKGGVE